jgi:hypothetical protein
MHQNPASRRGIHATGDDIAVRSSQTTDRDPGSGLDDRVASGTGRDPNALAGDDGDRRVNAQDILNRADDFVARDDFPGPRRFAGRTGSDGDELANSQGGHTGWLAVDLNWNGSIRSDLQTVHAYAGETLDHTGDAGPADATLGLTGQRGAGAPDAPVRDRRGSIRGGATPEREFRR